MDMRVLAGLRKTQLQVVFGLSAAVILAACSGRQTTPGITAELASSAVVAPSLPPVPQVNGRLDLRVVYPPSGAVVPSVDSNFIFGSTGSGAATLQINGTEVRVLPNGSFLGFLPLPAGDTPTFRLVAVRGSDSVALEHRLRRVIPPRGFPSGGRLMADSGSVAPAAGVWRLPDDVLRVSIRASVDATVELQSGRGRVPLALRGVTFAGDVPAAWLSDPASFIVRRGSDSIVVPVPPVRVLDPARLPLGVVGTGASALPDSDRVVVARPVVGGTYKWFLQPGTMVPISGREATAWRIRLDPQLDVWVDAAEIESPGITPVAPSRVAGNVRIRPGDGWTDVMIPMSGAPPYSVEVVPGGIELLLHGVTANTDIVHYAAGDSLVDRLHWAQEASGRARYSLTLRRSVWGYYVRHENGVFTLRLRHPPRVEPIRPLQGITVAVDAGHPPAGSTGPTGLYEAVATLAIGDRLRSILEGRGARVVMTRTGPAALGLADRPMIARRAGAHVFVSIHLNALPDGVNPFRAHGTGTYYFTGQSVALARAVQWGMVRRMGLRDLGINYDNLAVIRGTWMPSILCEGAFLMIPEQEAALRTPEFQDAYATGVADGLERFFREQSRVPNDR